MEFITAYSRKLVVDTKNESPSMTQQHFKRDCDINAIVNRMARGINPPCQTIPGIYTDISETGDYRTALNTLEDAQRDFGQLPSSIRRRFGNNPVEFLDFVQNRENLEEAISLGLVQRIAPPPAPATETKTEESV